MVSSDGSSGKGSASKFIHMIAGRIQFFVFCWTEDLPSLPAVDQRPLSVPCHGGLSNMAAYLIKVYKPRRQSSLPARRRSQSCNLITELSSHMFCYVLSNTDKTLGPLQTSTTGMGIIQGHNGDY